MLSGSSEISHSIHTNEHIMIERVALTVPPDVTASTYACFSQPLIECFVRVPKATTSLDACGTRRLWRVACLILVKAKSQRITRLWFDYDKKLVRDLVLDWEPGTMPEILIRLKHHTLSCNFVTNCPCSRHGCHTILLGRFQNIQLVIRL